MRKLRWQLLIVLAALIAIAVLLLTQQQTRLPVGKSAAEPLAGGVYTEALVGSVGRLNPVLDYYNAADHDIDRLLYSGLIRFDHRGLPQGDLAETWAISYDGTSYSFSIRANANWHDGRPVTSDDVIFTIDLMRDEAIPTPDDLREFWMQVDAVVIDDKTIQFVLPEPFSPFLDYLTFGVLPSHRLAGLSAEQIIASDFNLKPVGSGPFRFAGLDVVDDKVAGVMLSANADYYGKKPFIEQVVFRYYPTSTAAMTAYQQGQVMGISQVTADVLPQALKETNLNVFTARLPRQVLILLNLNSPDLPFFQDAQVRRALLMGLNRRWITDRILGGQAIIANSPVFPESWAYYDGVEQVEYDSQTALAMLKKAEYTIPAEGGQVRAKEGVRLAFQMVYPDEDPYSTIAEWVKTEWARLGVAVELVPVSPEELLDDHLAKRNYQAALVELNLARTPDPDPYPFWHQAQAANGQNYSQWDDRQVSEYLERARIEVELSERTRLYRNFQVRFSNDLPALLLYYPVYTYAVSDQIKGASIGPLYDPSDRFFNITLWYLLSGAGATATP